MNIGLNLLGKNIEQLFIQKTRYFHQGRRGYLSIRVAKGFEYQSCFTRSYSDCGDSSELPDSSILRRDQRSLVVKDSFITGCEVSHLASNRPSEDKWFASRLVTQEQSYLFGVLDGHGGETCSLNVSQRLSDYVTAFLLSKDKTASNKIKTHCATHLFDAKSNIQNVYDFTKDFLCKQSLEQLFNERTDNQLISNVTGSREHIYAISTAIKQAFLNLDDDLHEEALRSLEDPYIQDIMPYLLTIQSGCCVLASYLTKNSVFIANTGDCRAVAGIKGENGDIVPHPLSVDQTAGNPDEVSRITCEHPAREAHSLFSNGRLLGILAPLRAFGDAWLKWESYKITECFKFLYGPEARDIIPLFYDTPPYLTAEPEVTCYPLPESGLKFLILATDGLWDLLSNDQAIAVVEKHLRMKGTGSIVDCETGFDNTATALIRYALSRGNEDRLSTMLSYPYPQVRMYRDDITVMVIFF